MQNIRMMLSLVCFLALVTTGTYAADKKSSPTFLDGESAGHDFAMQGEYEGIIGQNTKLGAQVIARGGGKFDAVLFSGGLPGAKDSGKVKVRLQGETSDGAIQFTGKNFVGTIADGNFTGKAEESVTFALKKVERKSKTLGARPPTGAVVLFSGRNADEWKNVKVEEDNLLGVGGTTKRVFRDFHLHLEFRTPFMPYATGQARGNSGMYLLDQYECQVLDSFGLSGESNECGGIYKIAKPLVNMCYPPLSWQTYDVDFQAARFNDKGEKVADAVTTIRHNGVVIHENLKLPHITPGGGRSDEQPGALFLQNHGNPVRFRNMWIVEKSPADG